MATIRKRGNSYELRAFAGYDLNGKQIVKSTSWKIPVGMSEKKAEKEAMKEAILFEEKVNQGQIAEGKPMKFAEYVEKWFSDYSPRELKPKTIDAYRNLMDRILPVFGHLYIDKIRPAHLTKFYADLSKTNKSTTYSCKIDLVAVLDGLGLSMTQFSKKYDIPMNAIKSSSNGRNITIDNATKIAKAIKKPFSEVYSPTEQATLSSATISKYHRVLSSMFQTAVELQFIVSNPCDRVKSPKATEEEKKKKKKSTQYLTAEESIRMLQLLEDEPPQYRNAITLLLYSGMRRGELLGLEWSDFDEEYGIIVINKTIQYLPKKGIFEGTPKNESSNRVIKLSTSAIHALKMQKKWQLEQQFKLGTAWNPSGKIFTTATGAIIHPDTLTGWFHNFIERSDLPNIHLHNLRHTNATLQIANGSAVTTVAGYLGHANANTTTKIYAHAIQEAQAKSAELLEDILHPKKELKRKQA